MTLPDPKINADTPTGDGRDELGRDLTVTIRIGPDGSLYLSDVTMDMLPVVAALCPDDPELRRRLDAARAFRRGRRE